MSTKLGAYIVLTHKYIPARNEAGKKWEVIEECEFVDRVKDRMYNNATVIMDCKNRTLLKRRDDRITFENMEFHIDKTYGDKYKQFLEIVGLQYVKPQYEDKNEGTEAPST